MADKYVPRLRKKYDDSIAKAMTEKFGYKNHMEVPKIEKITINMGVGEGSQDKKKVTTAAEEMALISGQKPVITRAKKSIAQFKLREGMPIGCKVTLRRERMYEFLDRLITVAMPRIRDFRGVNAKSFDGRGNYAMGLRSRSSSRRSATTRSRRCAGWTSSSPPLRRPTTKRANCCACSVSRSRRMPALKRRPPEPEIEEESLSPWRN